MADAVSERPGGLAATVAETTGFLNDRLPGLVHDKTHIYESPEDLLNSDYGRGRKFSEKELADIHSAEGFFDPKTGHTIVIAGYSAPASLGLRAAIAAEQIGATGLTSYGNAVNEADNRAAQLLADAKLIEAEDPEKAAELRAKAEDISQHRQSIAAGKQSSSVGFQLWIGGVAWPHCARRQLGTNCTTLLAHD